MRRSRGRSWRFLEKGSTKRKKKKSSSSQPQMQYGNSCMHPSMTVTIMILPKIQTLFASMLTGCMSLFMSISILVSHIQTARSFSSKLQDTQKCALWFCGLQQRDIQAADGKSTDDFFFFFFFFFFFKICLSWCLQNVSTSIASSGREQACCALIGSA